MTSVYRNLVLGMICMICTTAIHCSAQRSPNHTPSPELASSDDTFVVMSWNVENLFDCVDDPDKDDADFLPTSQRQWTPARYHKKLNQIAEGISQAGRWQWPMLVGLLEIENDSCARHLLQRTPLGRMGYDYRITDGQDRRGVDVALLFLSDRFCPIETHEYYVVDPADSTFRTRSILHVVGRINTGDLLDVFVCHFPSRRGGASSSMPRRGLAAERLRMLIDSAACHRYRPAFIVLGDFNGDPQEVATAEILAALPLSEIYLSAEESVVVHRSERTRRLPNASQSPSIIQESVEEKSSSSVALFNLFYRRSAVLPPGSYLYRGVWSQLDHIIVSSSCLDGTVLSYLPGSARNVVFPGATRSVLHSVGRIAPRRTYAGTHYQGGPSDHLPVVASFRYSR